MLLSHKIRQNNFINNTVYDQVSAALKPIIDIDKTNDSRPDRMRIRVEIRYEMQPGYYTIIKNIYVLGGAKFIAAFFFVDMKSFLSIYVGFSGHVWGLKGSVVRLSCGNLYEFLGDSLLGAVDR